MKPVTFVVRSGWQQELSGAATFLRGLFRGLGEKEVSFEVLEMKFGSGPASSHCTPSTRDFWARKAPSAESFRRLGLGYLSTLWNEFRHLRQHQEIRRAGTLVVNEFGCETLPVAARMACPTAFVVALAHTHPGTDARARHPVRRFVERLCYRAVSDVIFNSNAVKEEWRRKLRCRAIRGRVIWYGLPEPPSQEQVDYPPRPFDTVDFVCVSRFVRWKGHRELLQAWFLAQQAVKSRIRLLLVGDGPTLPEMQHLVSRLGLGNSVLFCGARPDGAAFFARADVGVQLSVEPEAFGFVLLEAMCRQRPVIASRLGGITEVVEHEETGLLVNPHDPQTVVRAICRLAESPELRRTMGQRGYERWRRHFTLERMVTEYAGYLESIP